MGYASDIASVYIVIIKFSPPLSLRLNDDYLIGSDMRRDSGIDKRLTAAAYWVILSRFLVLEANSSRSFLYDESLLLLPPRER